MADIKASISFSSQNALSYPFFIEAQFSGLVDSGHTIRTKVLGTAQGSDAVTVSKANDKKDVAYLYVRNLSAEQEKTATVYTGTTNIAHIGGGEFLLMPAAPDIDFKVFVSKVGQMIEYAVFGVDDTQANLG